MASYTQAITIDIDTPNPHTRHPGVEYLARMAHARHGIARARREDFAWIPWEDLPAEARVDLCEGVAAVVDVMCHVTGAPTGGGHPLNAIGLVEPGAPMDEILARHEAAALRLQR